MSKALSSLPNLLAHTVRPKINLCFMDGDAMKAALTPWIGSGAAQKLRVEERRLALEKLLADPARMRTGLNDLPELQLQLLKICRRYGGAITGNLLVVEATARGLLKEAPNDSPRTYYDAHKSDPVLLLCRRMLLVSWEGRPINEYGYGYASYNRRRHYPDVALFPGLTDSVEPVTPLAWPTPPSGPPSAVDLRSTAEVAFDLWTTAQTLHDSDTWKTNKGGSLPKKLQNRLRKVLTPPVNDPAAPPDIEGLYYELLRGLDAVDIKDGEGWLDRAAVQKHLDRPAVQQSWRLVQAWMHMKLWQDGIGVVPDRDSDYNSVRIRPDQLQAAREMLVWTLQRVAHGPNDWLDLVAFVAEFWEQTHDDVDFYWSDYSWQPDLHFKARADRLTDVQKRQRHFWLEQEGTWVANALMGTLAYLGLVERGDLQTRPCFRLTPLGQAVFAAPESTPLPETSPRFLTVQPNHEIVAYLNAADAAVVWPLARMAQRVSTTSGLVQTFALTRDSVYQALESGLTLEQMQAFLREHSSTGLPENVAVSLSEWGRKREALTLRIGVTLLVAPSEPAVVLAKPAPAEKKPEVVVNSRHAPTVCWHVEEDGGVKVDKKADAVALARLSQLADSDGSVWRITAESARRARGHGIRAEQVLGWIVQHAGAETPPLLETMIRNWTDGGSVFLGELLLLQAPQEQVCAVLREHQRFQSFFLAHVPPNWFIVRPEKRDQLECLLHEMGFATTVSWKPPAPKKAEPEKQAKRKKRRP